MRLILPVYLEARADNKFQPYVLRRPYMVGDTCPIGLCIGYYTVAANIYMHHNEIDCFAECFRPSTRHRLLTLNKKSATCELSNTKY